jgi:hypothetical protein
LSTINFVVIAKCEVPLLLRRWKRIEGSGEAPVSVLEAVAKTARAIGHPSEQKLDEIAPLSDTPNETSLVTPRRLNGRALLRREVVENLKKLETFWAKVTREPSPQGSSEEMEFEVRCRLVETPLPAWSHTMWRSQASNLPDLLDEDEFAQVAEYHDRLDKLSELQARMSGYFETAEGQHLKKTVDNMWSTRRWETAQGKSWAHVPQVSKAMMDFNGITRSLWNQCMDSYSVAQHLGNSIKLD